MKIRKERKHVGIKNDPPNVAMHAIREREREREKGSVPKVERCWHEQGLVLLSLIFLYVFSVCATNASIFVANSVK